MDLESDLLGEFERVFEEEQGPFYLDRLSNYCENEKIAAKAARLLEKIQINQMNY